eukprot:CAMPEP_0118824714 /NCGR_PEP_ID=MMETSP1162-20130426/10795_1 /TAXON_ID=33656 /ORGANISM="Phaeocystis Sp, Strain CCMP2710" /LENGTH=297 /DNA_ID=CAMNT_0006755355 /DNA_START=1 /DNA_END=890 /DNA_ORIENTATION=+
MNEAPEDVRSSKSLRDGAMPCCVLTLLLVAAAGLGAAAVWLSLAAFDPEHSTSSLALLSKPVPGAVHNATATATSGSDDKSSGGGGGGGGGGRGGFRFEAASIDDETWQVTAVRGAEGVLLTWASAISELREGRLGPALNAQLAASPHAAFYWETPPTSLASAAATRFAFVTVAAPALARAEPDPGPFAAQLEPCAGAAEARSFANLGGDATLVAPCAMAAAPAAQYAHLGSFVRRAAAAQQAAFWREVGETIARTLEARGEAPTWVSTEGSGVAWLHVRLDARPKYYHHAPYRAFA